MKRLENIIYELDIITPSEMAFAKEHYRQMDLKCGGCNDCNVKYNIIQTYDSQSHKQSTFDFAFDITYDFAHDFIDFHYGDK